MSGTAPTEASRFLLALGQALAAASLYRSGHPARDKAIDVLHDELTALLALTPNPRFSFIGDEVIFGRMALRAARDWSMGPRLSKAGIQWLEFTDSATRDDLRGFIADASAVLAAPAGTPIDPLLFQRNGIKWGMVSIKDGAGRVSENSGEYAAVQGSGWDGGGASGTGGQGEFAEEAEATRWIATALNGGRSFPLAEAQGVIRSLAVALHQDRDVLQPLFRIGDSRDASTQSLGVSTLAMAFAEHLGMRNNEVRAVGVAALLHNVGLSKVPADILQKVDSLTPAEVAEYRKHTEHGARMLLASPDDLSLAAVVAYEHHLTPDGTGYPVLRHKREMNKVSKMVAICASYHARRSAKSFRPAIVGDAVLDQMEWYAGSKYDSELCVAFVAMMREAESLSRGE